MRDNCRHILQIVARLFDYPDEAWLGCLPQLRQEVADLVGAHRRGPLIDFIDQAAAMPPIRCQEQYTATFDLSPSSSLDLTYHRYGDSEDRLRALQSIKEIYVAAGFETISRELPDFMPMVLEFLTVAPEANRREILRATGPGLLALDGKFHDTQSPYAKLTSQLIDLLDLRDKGTAGGNRQTELKTKATFQSMEKRP